MRLPPLLFVSDLAPRIGTPDCPVLVDIRIDPDFDEDPRILPGARRHDYRDVEGLRRRLAGRPALVYCQKGKKLSLGLAALLRHHGGDASALAGGQFAWRDAGHPMLPATRMPAPSAGAATLWVTEDQPGVEALACAWLIRRFIDPEAVILPIPAAEVAGVAEKFAAVPFAMEDNGFDRMRQTFGLHGPALDRLGTLVGSAGRGDGNAMPQAPGLTAAVDGLARIHHDAADRLTASITVFDAFFGWARHQEADR